jgi:hypothetical protein
MKINKIDTLNQISGSGIGNGEHKMAEIHFIVEEAPEGGYIARALGCAIFTEADDIPALHAQVRDAVHCHFDGGTAPELIRLHFSREEVIAA